MKVIVYEPKKNPYVKEISDKSTGFREDVKDIVGEDLDFRPIRFDDGTIFQMIINDLGVVNKLPKNRRIYKGALLDYDVVRGAMVITQVEDGITISVQEKYIDILLNPENDFEWATEDDKDSQIDYKVF